jgi:hypothetical protein
VRERGLASGWIGLAAAIAWAPLLAPSTARADEASRNACLQAYEGSQENRKAEALRSARQQLLVCASDSCPPIVRTDCIRWLAEVEAALPTIVLEARGAGGPLFDVTVSLDGAPLVHQLDGRPIEIDPGLHTLTFEHAGSPNQEQKVIVREGEKNRLVSADWTPAPAPVAQAPAPTPPVAMERPVPTSVYVALGVAALGFVDFAVAGTLGFVKQKELEKSPSCAPFCPANDVRYIKTTYAAADVGLAVGAAGLLASGILFLTRPERPVATHIALQGIVLQPEAGGALVGWAGAF